MRRSRVIVCVMGLLMTGILIQPRAAEDELVQEQAAPHKVFQGILYRVWIKLRALNPKPQAERAGRGRIVVTAGIRGAESTETALKPYWKDDRTSDQAFLKQVETLNQAQQLLDDGKIQEAGAALQKFIQNYPEGELLPNALFAQGLAQSAAGDKAGGVKTLKQFIKGYPQHPLKQDAELVIAELGN